MQELEGTTGAIRKRPRSTNSGVASYRATRGCLSAFSNGGAAHTKEQLVLSAFLFDGILMISDLFARFLLLRSCDRIEFREMSNQLFFIHRLHKP